MSWYLSEFWDAGSLRPENFMLGFVFGFMHGSFGHISPAELYISKVESSPGHIYKWKTYMSKQSGMGGYIEIGICICPTE